MAKYTIGIYTDYVVDANSLEEATKIAFHNFKKDTGLTGVDAIVLDSPNLRRSRHLLECCVKKELPNPKILQGDEEDKEDI